MREIQVVFFDAAGTLFDIRGSVGEIYSRFARRYGVEARPEAIQPAFICAFRHQPPLSFPANTPETELKRLEYGWWRELALAVFAGYDFARFDEFFAEVFEFFRGQEAWEVFDDVVPTLEALKSRGLRLGVISNFDSRLFDLLRDLDLARYFDSIHISTRAGAAKPDPAIFQEALGHYSIKPSQAAHVGDSLREDVVGAPAAGLRVFLIDRRGEQPSAAGFVGLSSLQQLLEMF